ISRLKLGGTDLRTLIPHPSTLAEGVWGKRFVPQWGVWGEPPPIRVFPKNDRFSLKSVPFSLSWVDLSQ
ncbi:hypothetical protein, partial [Allocoleopsis sp.]|uniref:hypothetical protein n=1 Tax=Allocoleopsis sp. TaxID=3088169 RepID=UPI002FD75530